MNELQITVNGVEFQEIPYPKFVISGEEDRIPFMYSIETNIDSMFPSTNYRTYDALVINQRFFAPKFDENGKLKIL